MSGTPAERAGATGAGDVAVTGIGLATAAGGRADAWRSLLAGDVWDPSAGGSSADLLTRAVRESLVDSRPDSRGGGSESQSDSRTGWVLGASKPDPAGWPSPGGGPAWALLSPEGGHAVCDGFNATGPRATVVAACATGVAAVARAVLLIRHGTCDRVICGAADASDHPLTRASFAKLGVLSRSGRTRPFDVGRDGFTLGEGAAAFVLERADVADPGRVYATVTGAAVASAAVRLVDVDPAGEAVGRTLRDCTGGRVPDLLGLHGTATRANDPAEAAGVRAAFGDAGSCVPAFGSKGSAGHLLGAAGAVELAFTLLALRDGVIPPTPGLTARDPACGLNLAPAPRPAPLATAAKVSLGFGGTVAAVGLRRGGRNPD